MDLTKTYPRSPKDKLAGVVVLARTTDKAKAKAHGTLGEYHYNCPLDQKVFGFLGIDHEQYLEKVKNAKNDGEIEAYAKTFVAKKSSAEIEKFNADALAFTPQPGSDSEKHFLEVRASVAPHRTDVTRWPDLLDLDEKREVPRRAVTV